MAKVTFIEHDGTEHVVEASNGFSLMETAVRNGVRGIEADCGGACACATCHVYVEAAWAEAAGAPAETETEMLEFAVHAQPNSRLSCQIKMTDALDGLVVRLPVSQH